MGHWQAMALSWAVAVLLVGVGYVTWSWKQGVPVHWDYLGFAALIGGGGALLLMAWRSVRERLLRKGEEGQSEGGDE